MDFDPVTAMAAAAASWAAVKVELRYQRRDIDALKKNLVKLARAVRWLQAKKRMAN